MTSPDRKQHILDQIQELPETEKTELLSELYPEVQKLRDSFNAIVDALNDFSHKNLM